MRRIAERGHGIARCTPVSMNDARFNVGTFFRPWKRTWEEKWEETWESHLERGSKRHVNVPVETWSHIKDTANPRTASGGMSVVKGSVVQSEDKFVMKDERV